MSNSFLTQKNIPAMINGTGYIGGEFYLHCTLYDPEQKRHYNALVNLKDASEVKEHYQKIYADSDDEQVKVLTSNFIQNQGSKSTDSASVLEKQVENHIEKHIDSYDSNDVQEIKMKEFSGIPCYLSNVVINGMVKGGNAPQNASGGFELSQDQLDDDPNALYIANALTVKGFGLKLSPEQLEANCPLEDIMGNHMRIAPISIAYRPAHLDKSELPKDSFDAYEIISAKTVTIASMLKDPEAFEEAMFKAFSPVDPTNPTQPNIGYTDVVASFKSKDGRNNFVRLDFPSNYLTGSENFTKTPDELYGLAMQKQEVVLENLDSLLAIEDPYSNTKTPDPDIIAKLDALRIMTMATYQPNRYLEFLSDVKNKKPDAFEGVTAKNYFDETKPLNDNEKFVKNFVEASVDNPESVIINISTRSKLNIGADAEKKISKYLAHSYYKNLSPEAISNNQIPNALLESGEPNAGLDIHRGGGTNKKALENSRLVIPVMITSFMGPAVSESDPSHDDIDEEVPLIKQDLFVPVFNFVPNPIKKKGEAYNAYKYDPKTLTVFDDRFIPEEFLRRNKVNLPAFRSYAEPAILSKRKPSEEERLKASTDPNYVNSKLGDALIHKSVKLAEVDLNANRKINYLPLSNTTSGSRVRQINKIANTLAFGVDRKTGAEWENFTQFMAEKDKTQKFSEGHDNPRYQQALDRASEFRKVAKGFFHSPLSQKTLTDILMSPEGKQAASLKHEILRDILLGDKPIQVTYKNETGNFVTEDHNFQDLVGKIINSNNPIADPITSDVPDKQQKVSDDAVIKITSVDELGKWAIERLEQATKVQLGDIENESMRKDNNPTAYTNELYDNYAKAEEAKRNASPSLNF